MTQKRFQLVSFNANGIRSAVNKGLLPWLEKTQPDCMCVQELKAQQAELDKAELTQLAGLQGYFHLAQKKGYSGVAVYTRHTPSDVVYGWDGGEFDAEGRCVELRFDTPARRLSIISAYFPSGSSGEDRQAAKYRFLDGIYPYLNALQQQREFILCGDINIAHQAIDLKNWRSNQKNSGFLPEERAWMTKLLSDASEGRRPLVDVYRRLRPDATDACYTWWSNRGQARANNVGWRLDYHLATPALAELARTEHIYTAERFSDHAPLTIGYDLALA
ncbi:exodeoxyribonuclease III [Allofranklinella schreckenbergeri]|uniref:Exodeoxyribonuclease III n=1 Tax=Allofranklinella schreckenbergeri TaxID=1076744 RepID=A0A3M6Q5Y3_9BURK|nr:exodeoxyribonuclease III [Allofranklinella schreckenbergeri]RMW97828.1 exodeoxyribonuclease III [Allofranklinella schreckenbergeri]